jgi:hypothetical protein
MLDPFRAQTNDIDTPRTHLARRSPLLAKVSKM